MDLHPGQAPIGVLLWNTATLVSRAFDDALSAVGGSRSVWAVMLALKKQPAASQRELAAEVGIQGATLTHHLAAMEADGLISRRRDPANRRVHIVELTDHGEATFHRLRDAATAYDRKVRSGIAEEDIAHLRNILDCLQANAVSDAP